MKEVTNDQAVKDHLTCPLLSRKTQSPAGGQ